MFIFKVLFTLIKQLKFQSNYQLQIIIHRFLHSTDEGVYPQQVSFSPLTIIFTPIIPSLISPLDLAFATPYERDSDANVKKKI